MLKSYFTLSCLALFSFAYAAKFESKKLGSDFFQETTEVGCFIDDMQIGTIEITRLPFSLYILHSFFVGEEYRNQGYGSELLYRACNQIDVKKPRTVLIQPGPFEITRDGFSRVTEPDERDEKIERLCKLYEKVGFRKVSKPVYFAAVLFYKLVGLQEDARYLMAK